MVCCTSSMCMAVEQLCFKLQLRPLFMAAAALQFADSRSQFTYLQHISCCVRYSKLYGGPCSCCLEALAAQCSACSVDQSIWKLLFFCLNLLCQPTQGSLGLCLSVASFPHLFCTCACTSSLQPCLPDQHSLDSRNACNHTWCGLCCMRPHSNHQHEAVGLFQTVLCSVSVHVAALCAMTRRGGRSIRHS